MDEETRDAAIEILEGMSERLEATFAEVAERHAPFRAEINALLEAAGSDKSDSQPIISVRVRCCGR